MPQATISVEIDVQESFRVASMRGMFDVPLEKKLKHEWNIDFPIDHTPWNVGLIVGASGSGKTTVAKKLFGEQAYHEGFPWDKDKSILDCFPPDMKIQEITNLLSHVGFSSPPSWVKPFHVLSNGQKFRVDLARVLCEKNDLTVIDEFTSVVDRNVAKVGSHAVSKTAKKLDKKIVCLSCHYDILEWLEPDWVYDMSTGQFSRRLHRRPQIELSLFRVHYKAWELFKEHHYLTTEINRAARCYLAELNNEPVAFTSVIAMPSGSLKRAFRGHRTVVLPDYQGIGIGNALTMTIGEMYKQEGCRFFSITSHPAFIQARTKNPKWKLTRKPSRQRVDKMKPTATKRLTCTFEYIG